MFELFKKVNRSIDCPVGSRMLEEGENPFLEGPCLLCVSPQDRLNRTIFGFTKQGARMARVRVRGNAGARIPIDEIPVSFLSIRPDQSKEPEADSITKLVTTYIKPLLVDEEGKAKAKEEAKRCIRNVNMISNCDGTRRALAICAGIEGVLTELGYSREDMDEIMSQVTLMSFQTEKDLTECRASVIDFHNINDTEVMVHDGNIPDEMLDRHAETKNGESIAIDGRRIEVLVSGKDSHGIRDYMDFGEATPVAVHTIVSSVLENAIENSRGKAKPLSIDELYKKTKKVYERIDKGEKKEDLISELDESLSYGGNITRLTDREVRMLEENDKAMITFENQRRDLGYSQEAEDKLRKQKTDMLRVSEQSCSEGTHLRILQASGWQVNTGQKKTIASTKPDREVVEDQARTIEEQGKTIETQEETVKKLQGMLKRSLDFATEVRNSVFGKIFFRKAIKELPEGTDNERE